MEICAGAGGQAVGLEAAGFTHVAAVELEPAACATLRRNRPAWHVIEGDIRDVEGTAFRGVDLLAGGVPCPPFSIAGKQLGADDERDLFPEAIRIAQEARPSAIMLENVRGLATQTFAVYRRSIITKLLQFGYQVDWRVLNASEFGVPQLRPRFVLIALRPEYARHFQWPICESTTLTVGEAIGDLMAARGWPGAEQWRRRARGIAPTLVGGSKKHGGPDLGPTRARLQWASLGVDGLGLADFPPSPDFPVDAFPRLTTRMVARLQGFPDTWDFAGRKTAAYRQIGNALPPPVARSVGEAVARALTGQTIEPTPGKQLELAR